METRFTAVSGRGIGVSSSHHFQGQIVPTYSKNFQDMLQPVDQIFSWTVVTQGWMQSWPSEFFIASCTLPEPTEISMQKARIAKHFQPIENLLSDYIIIISFTFLIHLKNVEELCIHMFFFFKKYTQNQVQQIINEMGRGLYDIRAFQS